LAEFSVLKEEKRPKAVERLARARAMGDLSENSEYAAAREELSFVDGRINEIDAIIKDVKIINEQKSGDVVKIGDTVTVEINGDQTTYHIVGQLEADIQEGKISDTSPIGKALIGARAGAEIIAKAPAGEVKYKVVAIK